MISPKKSTAVTEIRTAQNEGTSLSRKIGRASIAVALDNKRVTSRKWCFFKIGKITEAYVDIRRLRNLQLSFLQVFLRIILVPSRANQLRDTPL